MMQTFMVLGWEAFLVRFGVALALGMAIGVEREMIGKRAGVRTMMLVCAGAALYAMMSLLVPALAGAWYGENSVRAADLSRIVSNVAVGIGFLGAGVIIKTQEQVRGLTTAATIWFTAAIGAMVGLGFVWFGVVAGVGVSTLLFLLRGVDMTKNVEE
jgi:putative Mg2+ transporter-C (MgtC) family protein